MRDGEKRWELPPIGALWPEYTVLVVRLGPRNGRHGLTLAMQMETNCAMKKKTVSGGLEQAQQSRRIGMLGKELLDLRHDR